MSRSLMLAFITLGALACGSEGSGDSDQAPVGEASSGVVTVDGAELRWLREGSGPTLFMLGSSVYYPKAYSAELREHFEIVFVDGRHFVPRYQPDDATLAAIDMETFADDVEAVRIALGYESISVVGHSVQGQIAMAYADKYPSTTERVVLVAPVPFAPTGDLNNQVWNELADDHRRAVMEERLATLDEVMADVPPERRFAEGYVHRAPLYWADPEYDATEVFAGLESGPAFARLGGSVVTREEARARLERINAPILLVLGRLDFVVPYTAWEELIHGLDNVEYVLLPDDSHNPQTESPERFDPILIEWFAGA